MPPVLFPDPLQGLGCPMHGLSGGDGGGGFCLSPFLHHHCISKRMEAAPINLHSLGFESSDIALVRNSGEKSMPSMVKADMNLVRVKSKLQSFLDTHFNTVGPVHGFGKPVEYKSASEPDRTTCIACTTYPDRNTDHCPIAGVQI